MFPHSVTTRHVLPEGEAVPIFKLIPRGKAALFSASQIAPCSLLTTYIRAFHCATTVPFFSFMVALVSTSRLVSLLIVADM